MEETAVRTAYRQEKDAQDLAIYQERKELMAQPGAMATAVDQLLMRKYGIHSKSTIWFIVQRVEKRLKQEEISHE